MAEPASQSGSPAGAPSPTEQLLEEIRSRIFEGTGGHLLAGDPRAQLIFERIAERLQEEPDEGDELEAWSFARPRRQSVLTRQWAEYIRQTLASIERRANMVDQQGCPRVTRVYRSLGSLRHIDLADWRGCHRVRVLFDGAGEPSEVRLLAICGEEVSYTQASFDPEGGDAGDGLGNSLGDCFERARRCSVLLYKDAAPTQEKAARVKIQALCDVTFPKLESLLKREQQEGRQLVPTSEELLEMSLEQILEHLEKATEA